MYSDHTGSVTGLDFNPNGLYLASTSYDKTIKIWDLRKGRYIYTLAGHSGPTSAVSFSANGAYFATGSMDTLAILWKSNCLSEEKTYKNTLNAFPRQFIKNDPLNSPVKIVTETKSKDNLSEELSRFFEKMVSQLQIVSKTIKTFDNRLDKIENILEEFEVGKVNDEEKNKLIERFGSIKKEYSDTFNNFEAMRDGFSKVKDNY